MCMSFLCNVSELSFNEMEKFSHMGETCGFSSTLSGLGIRLRCLAWEMFEAYKSGRDMIERLQLPAGLGMPWHAYFVMYFFFLHHM